MGDFKLNILGCGSATPSMRHMPSSQVLDIRGTLYMIDCGEGTQLQMRRQKLHFNKLRHIFISHLHGDHCLGLPGLLSTLSLNNSEGEITIHTTEEGARIFQTMMAQFCPVLSYKLDYNIVTPKSGVILENNAVTVETFPLYHRVPTMGFIFRERPKPRHLIREMIDFYQVPIAQRPDLKAGADFVTADGTVIPNERLTTPPTPPASYAYCSDTNFDPRVAQCVKGVDTIFHEATYADDNIEKARKRFHSTAREAGRIARMAGANRLIIGHYSKSYTDTERHLKEATEEFPNVIAADEGMKIDLSC